MILCAIIGGEPLCYDTKGFGNGVPIMDASQDIVLYNTYFLQGSLLQFSFKRKLNTGDVNDQILTAGKS